MPAPICRRCERRHFNFDSCLEAARKEAQTEADRVYVEWSREGERPWAGDRLETLERHGNTFWKRRGG